MVRQFLVNAGRALGAGKRSPSHDNLANCHPLELQQPTETTPRVLWYLHSQGCPEGEAFLRRLGADVARVRSAHAGDRIDFVLTLEQSGEKSFGRLERQTARGTIAVSELEDVSCEAVADALALSLALASQPHGGVTPMPSASLESSTVADTATAETAAPSESSVDAEQPEREAVVRARQSLAGSEAPEPTEPALGVRLGAEGGAAAGPMPELTPTRCDEHAKRLVTRARRDYFIDPARSLCRRLGQQTTRRYLEQRRAIG